MRKNRYQSSSCAHPRLKTFFDVGPAWWGLTIVASMSFVWAIVWMLTVHPA